MVVSVIKPLIYPGIRYQPFQELTTERSVVQTTFSAGPFEVDKVLSQV